MGKFRQILTELSVRDMPILSFPDDNFSKCQGILTKLRTCIGIKEVWFGIANGQISSIFDSYLPAGYYGFRFYLHINLLIKYSVQQQIHFNGNVFRNNCCRCNEVSQYFRTSAPSEDSDQLVHSRSLIISLSGTDATL